MLADLAIHKDAGPDAGAGRRGQREEEQRRPGGFPQPPPESATLPGRENRAVVRVQSRR